MKETKTIYICPEGHRLKSPPIQQYIIGAIRWICPKCSKKKKRTYQAWSTDLWEVVEE